MSTAQLTPMVSAVRSLLVESVRDASLLWKVIWDSKRGDTLFAICQALICLHGHNLLGIPSL